MIRKPRTSALHSGRDDTFELDGDNEFPARRICDDVGHDARSWPRGPHHHHANAPRSATWLARSAAVGEFDICNRNNFARARRAYPGGRAMGVRVRSMWWVADFSAAL